MSGPAPAIAGAIAQALDGGFINHLPILPESVMQQLADPDRDEPGENE